MLKSSWEGVAFPQTSKRPFPKICTLWGGPILSVTILTYSSAADAAEIKIFTSRAIATVLEKIGPRIRPRNRRQAQRYLRFQPRLRETDQCRRAV